MSDQLGVEVEVLDEPSGGIAPTQTDTCILLHSVDNPAHQGIHEITSAGQARALLAGEAAVLAATDTFFAELGGRLILSTLPAVPSGSGSGDEDVLDEALDRITAEHGPAQLCAPECVTAAEIAHLADWGWTTNRIYLPDGPADATDDELAGLAADVIASSQGRFSGLEADTLIVPGTASGQTREVPASIVKAALIARNDIATANPNLAAAGVQGMCRYAVGIKAERNDSQRDTLDTAQVNTFKTVNGTIRAYGFRTLADLTALPHWWDLSGSRTVMAVRAREAAVAEALYAGQIDGEGAFLARYEGALRGELKELQRLGALYGTASNPGYRVTVSTTNNPVGSLAQGRVTAEIVLRTSPYAKALKVDIIRRAITQEV